MSYKAMWNNPNVQTCAARDCSASVQTGSGIPSGLVVYHSCRVFRFGAHGMKFGKSAEYGQLMTRAAAEALDRETGRTVPYGRNVVQFVGSRASRKHGIAPTAEYTRRAVRASAMRLQTV